MVRVLNRLLVVLLAALILSTVGVLVGYWQYHVGLARDMSRLTQQLGIVEEWASDEHIVSFFQRTLSERVPEGTDATEVQDIMGRSGFSLMNEATNPVLYFISLTSLPLLRENDIYVYVYTDEHNKVKRLVVDNS